MSQYFASSTNSEVDLSRDDETPSSVILDKIFFFLYTNQYNSMNSSTQTPSPTAEKKRRLSSSTTTTTVNIAFDTTRLMFEGAVKYGVDVLALLCLQDIPFFQLFL